MAENEPSPVVFFNGLLNHHHCDPGDEPTVVTFQCSSVDVGRIAVLNGTEQKSWAFSNEPLYRWLKRSLERSMTPKGISAIRQAATYRRIKSPT